MKQAHQSFRIFLTFPAPNNKEDTHTHTFPSTFCSMNYTSADLPVHSQDIAFRLHTAQAPQTKTHMSVSLHLSISLHRQEQRSMHSDLILCTSYFLSHTFATSLTNRQLTCYVMVHRNTFTKNVKNVSQLISLHFPPSLTRSLTAHMLHELLL